MRQQTTARKAKAALIGMVGLALLAVGAVACSSGTSNSDKTSTAAAGQPASASSPAAAADTPTVAAATSPQASTTTAAGASSATIQAKAVPATGLKDVTGAALTQYLTDGDGNTLYIFKNDVPNSGKSAVPAAIAANWPPVTTTGAPAAGTGITASALGSFTGADGKTWVTYNGMPLYYYAGDKAAGDTKGEGLGGIWFAVGP